MNELQPPHIIFDEQATQAQKDAWDYFGMAAIEFTEPTALAALTFGEQLEEEDSRVVLPLIPQADKVAALSEAYRQLIESGAIVKSEVDGDTQKIIDKDPSIRALEKQLRPSMSERERSAIVKKIRRRWLAIYAGRLAAFDAQSQNNKDPSPITAALEEAG